jgi:hypothetical protein
MNLIVKWQLSLLQCNLKRPAGSLAPKKKPAGLAAAG